MLSPTTEYSEILDLLIVLPEQDILAKGQEVWSDSTLFHRMRQEAACGENTWVTVHWVLLGGAFLSAFTACTGGPALVNSCRAQLFYSVERY